MSTDKKKEINIPPLAKAALYSLGLKHLQEPFIITDGTDTFFCMLHHSGGMLFLKPVIVQKNMNEDASYLFERAKQQVANRGIQ